jgi:branched-chain amino acid transport system ATP-binding protein
MPSQLSTADLSVRYGRAAAVKDVEIVVPPGSVTGLVGPNGAGKSSLLLALYGSVASTGTVLLDGEDLAALGTAARLRRGIAIVPQGRQFFPRLTVRENLRVATELLRAPARAVDEALDRFPILRKRSRSLAGVLSGGEQQMLVVSRALIGSPKVLLLDEMATGLAPVIVAGLAETFASLARDGVAVLYAAPEIGAVRGIIDRGYVMIRGEMVAKVEDGGLALDSAYRTAMGADLG